MITCKIFIYYFSVSKIIFIFQRFALLSTCMHYIVSHMDGHYSNYVAISNTCLILFNIVNAMYESILTVLRRFLELKLHNLIIQSPPALITNRLMPSITTDLMEPTWALVLAGFLSLSFMLLLSSTFSKKTKNYFKFLTMPFGLTQYNHNMLFCPITVLI